MLQGEYAKERVKEGASAAAERTREAERAARERAHELAERWKGKIRSTVRPARFIQRSLMLCAKTKFPQSCTVCCGRISVEGFLVAKHCHVLSSRWHGHDLLACDGCKF